MSDAQSIWLLQLESSSELALRLAQLQQGRGESVGEWPIERFVQQMQAGDTLLFWISGLGLSAVGRLLSAAYLADADTPHSWHIGYEITGLLPKPLPRQQLKTLSSWSNAPFIRRPQGRNFKVSAAAWAELASALPPLIVPQGQPSRQKSLAKRAEKMRLEGLLLPRHVLTGYALALETSSLVILSGPSGVGKSWLAQLYARVSGAESCLLAVSPHWNQPEDWLGYFNPLEKAYFDSPASQFLKQAAQEWQTARRDNRAPQSYHLILDEMNLARIEHYFAPLLSGLEIVKRQGHAPLWLGGDEPVHLCPNLRVIGTINRDESTHLLADKIYDRAQVIDLYAEPAEIQALLAGLPYQSLLMSILTALSPLVPLSYRTCKEIRAYVIAGQELGLPWTEALDQQILQKLLARLRGSGADLPGILTQLEQWLPMGTYPLSHQRLQALRRQWQQEGYVFGH